MKKRGVAASCAVNSLPARAQAMFNRGMLFEVEAPEFNEVRVFMSAREALQVSFRAEKKAWVFFSEAAPRVQDAAVKELFIELRNEEVHHQRLVLAEMERTPPESALKHADVADEPVAQ